MKIQKSSQWFLFAAASIAVVPSVFADSLSDGGGASPSAVRPADAVSAPVPLPPIVIGGGGVLQQGSIRRNDRNNGPAQPMANPPVIAGPVQPDVQPAMPSTVTNAMVIYPWNGNDLFRRGVSGSVYGAQNFRNGLYLGTPGYGFGPNSSSPGYVIAFSSRFSACNWNGYGYQPYSASLGSVGAGKAGYGFSQLSDCAIATYDSLGGAVCNWNGSNYQPYNALTGKAIGTTDYGYGKLSSCAQATTNSIAGGAVCNWNGYNYQPYSVQNGLPVGRSGYGFSTLDSCSTATASVENGLVCNWAGSAYYQYDVISNQQIRGPYTSLSNCIYYAGH